MLRQSMIVVAARTSVFDADLVAAVAARQCEMTDDDADLLAAIRQVEMDPDATAVSVPEDVHELPPGPHLFETFFVMVCNSITS